MYIKINSEEFLGTFELNKLQKSFTEDGIIRNLLSNTKTFGLVKNALLNGNLIEAKDVFRVSKAGSPTGDIVIAPGLSIDKNGLSIINKSSVNISVSPDSQFYWVKIKHSYSILENGKVSIDVDGNLTGVNTKFTELFRGQPDYPTRISFPDATSNVLNYEVVRVISDTSAVIAGDFIAESNLDFSIYGTFTPGYIVPNNNKNIFQYDSVDIELVAESISNTAPTKLADEEFYIARVSFDGITLSLEDKRSEFWQTHSAYDLSFLDKTLVNSVIGVETVKWDVASTPKDTNEVSVAWGFRSSSYTIDTSSNKMTLLSGKGGVLKDTSYFVNGQFDGWKIYSANGSFRTIIDSQKTGSQILITLDNLISDDYSGSTEIIMVPPFEQIEIKVSYDEAIPLDKIKQLETKHCFNINEQYGKIYLRVAHDLYKYNLTFRYKTYCGYTNWQIFPNDVVGFYSETAFDSLGDVLPIVVSNTIAANILAGYLKPYVASLTNGFIPLKQNADSFAIFKSKVDTGDLFGVNTMDIQPLNFSPTYPLYVGTDKQYQHYIGSALVLTNDVFIELKSTRVDSTPLKEGNFFKIHINKQFTQASYTLRIVQDFIDSSTYTEIDSLSSDDFTFLNDLNLSTYHPKGITIRCTWNGTIWISDRVNETNSLPTGVIFDWTTPTAPTGFLICDGLQISRTTYAKLFSIIGTTFGIGDGSTTFALPDLRRRVVLGFDSSASATPTDNPSRTDENYGAIGNKGGKREHALAIAELAEHNHTITGTTDSTNIDHTHGGTTDAQNAAHTHNLNGAPYVILDGASPTSLGAGSGIGISSSTQTSTESANHAHGFTTNAMNTNATHTHTLSGTAANSGNGNPHENRQPYIVLNKIIKF